MSATRFQSGTTQVPSACPTSKQMAGAVMITTGSRGRQPRARAKSKGQGRILALDLDQPAVELPVQIGE